MQDITIGAFGSTLLWIVSICGGIGVLYKLLRDAIKKMLEEEFKSLNNKIDTVDKKIDNVDKETCKNFLVRFLADIERGEFIAEAEKQRFWEEYEHYIKSGGNSYVKEWVDKIKKEGKL